MGLDEWQRHCSFLERLPCAFCPEFGVWIHRFEIAHRTCRCGESTVAEPEKHRRFTSEFGKARRERLTRK